MAKQPCSFLARARNSICHYVDRSVRRSARRSIITFLYIFQVTLLGFFRDFKTFIEIFYSTFEFSVHF